MSNINRKPNETVDSKVPTLHELFGSDITGNSKDSEKKMEKREPGTHPPDIENNLKRCSHLMESENILAELEKRIKKQRLDVEAQRKEQKKIQTLTSLKLIGRASTWEGLDHTERWNKEYVLAILSCNSNRFNLPVTLSERKWAEYLRGDEREKQKLCHDLDLFLARLSRPEFKEYCRDENKNLWLKIFSEEALLQCHSNQPNWETTLSSIVELFPEVFPTIFVSEKCELKDVAKAYLHACCPKDLPSEDASHFLGLLSNNLRKDEDLMVLTLITFPHIQRIPEQLNDSCSFTLDLAKEIGPMSGRALPRISKFTPRVQADLVVAREFCEVDSSLYVDLPFSLRQKTKEVAEVASKGNPTLLLDHVPGNIQHDLTSNKAFMLSLFKNADALKDLPWETKYQLYLILSPALKKDTDVVLAAVKSRVLNMDRVPLALLPSVKQDLKQSSSFIMDTLRQHCCKKSEHILDPPPRDEELAIALRAIEEDRNLAMAALVEGLLPIQVPLPSCFACDPNFWKQAIQQDHSLWKLCPFVDEGFVLSFESPGPELMELMLNSFPRLSSDLDLWRRFLNNEEFYINMHDLYEYLQKHAAPNVLRDKDTMLLAISHDAWVYGNLPRTLQNDYQILEKMMERLIDTENGSLLHQIPMEIRVAYPNIVAKALEFVDETELGNVCEMLEPDERSNREILHMWFSIGGWWMEGIPDDVGKDEELMLLIAETNPDFFHMSSEDLLQNKDFILRALDKNGMLYRNVSSESLTHDFDVALAAWSTSKEVGDIFLARRTIDLLPDLLRK